jgi:hypothetical protein
MKKSEESKKVMKWHQLMKASIINQKNQYRNVNNGGNVSQ